MTCGSVPCHVNPEGREAWVVAGFVAQGCGCSPVHVLDGPVPFPEINMVVLFLVLSPAMEICDNHVTPMDHTYSNLSVYIYNSGWLGRAMVLGSFQYRGVLLLWHMVGQGACYACSRCGTGGLFFIFFISFVLSSFSKASSVGRRLDILKYCGLGRYNPSVVVSYYRRRAL